jgi:riboflavin kinase/FMN adenylyltransferase
MLIPMKIYDDIRSLDTIAPGLALSIGNFDGVHPGHLDIIDTLKARSPEGVAVMTFEPHPVAILHPEKAPGILTPLEYKKHLLQQAGVEHLIIIRDSYELLNLSPADFIDEFLVRHINPAIVVEGTNFNFGYGRSGDINTLKKLAEGKFEVVVVQPQDIDIQCGDHKAISSSSLARCLIEDGCIAQAADVLGRPYRLMGVTVPGRGIGTKIGFPTANIDPADQIIPAEGVYAGFVSIADNMTGLCAADQRRPAAFSIGRAKTFITDHPLLIEAHLLGDDPGDLTGKFLAMDFIKRLRSQQRFETGEELTKQIQKDCTDATKALQ